MRIVEGTLRELKEDEVEPFANRKRYATDYKYATVGEFKWQKGGRSITIKPGFLTDGSSGGPDYGCSWLFHDYLYATHCFDDGTPCTRDEADNIMEDILRHERHKLYAWAVDKLSAIDFFDFFDTAWENSGARGPEFLDRMRKDSVDSLGISSDSS